MEVFKNIILILIIGFAIVASGQYIQYTFFLGDTTVGWTLGYFSCWTIERMWDKIFK